MNALIAKILAARESWIKVGEFEFKIRRPSEMDIVRLNITREGNQGADVTINRIVSKVRECVVDWRDVKESDLIGAGGGALAVDFDSELFVCWIKDDATMLTELFSKIEDAINDFAAKKAQTAKN